MDNREGSAGVCPAQRYEAAIITLLAAAAFLIRFLYARQMLSTPYFELNTLKGLDMEAYVSWARNIAAGDVIGSGSFWQAPLYAYYAGFVLWIFHGSLHALVISQAILGTVTCLAVYIGARHFLSPFFSSIAAALLTFYSAHVFFTAITLTATFEVFLASFVLLAAIRAYRGPSAASWAVFGAFCGIASLARPNFLLLVPVHVAVSIVICRLRTSRKLEWPDRSRLIRLTAVFCALFAVMILPVTIRNASVTGKFILISGSGPETYRIANSYDSAVFNFVYPDEPVMPPWTAAFWKHQFLKAAGFWIAAEISQNADISLAYTYAPMLRLGFIPFILIGPPAIAAALSCRRLWELMPVYVFSGTYYVSMIPFFIISRFRLPVVPALAVLAALAAAETARLFKESRYSRGILMTATAVLTALLSWPWSLEIREVSSLNNLATLMIRKNDYSAAANLLQESIAVDPAQYKTHVRLGKIYAIEGNADRAIKHFEAAARIDPGNAETYSFLARVYRELKHDTKKADEMLSLYRRLSQQEAD